jgi:hypothetical protein
MIKRMLLATVPAQTLKQAYRYPAERLERASSLGSTTRLAVRHLKARVTRGLPTPAPNDVRASDHHCPLRPFRGQFGRQE